MADTAFTVKVDGRTFTLDRPTLGDWRMFRTEFGLKASDIVTSIQNEQGEQVDILNLDDPNVLVAMIVAALRHERPHAPISTLIDEVEALGMDGIEFPDAESEDEPDPTRAGDGEATERSPHGGKSGSRQKKPGIQR